MWGSVVEKEGGRGEREREREKKKGTLGKIVHIEDLFPILQQKVHNISELYFGVLISN